MALKNLSVSVEEANAGRADIVVRDLTELSRSQVRGIFDHDCVRINGVLCKDIARAVAAGDVLEVTYDPHTRYKERKRTWDDRTFQIAYEDEFVIVVNKAAGTLTVPTDNNESNTLVERVSVYLNHSRRNKEAWVVDRLDRDISGLILFAKQERMSQALIEIFKEQRPERVYVAVVAGVITEDEGTFQSHLTVGKDLGVYSGEKNRFSEEAITHFKVLKRGGDATLIELKTETTVRNQIRVHCNDAGHPVLGDARYGADDSKHPKWIRRRMALHVQSLSFHHPALEKVLTVEAELPRAIQKFMAGNRAPKKTGQTVASSPWERAKKS